MLRSGVRVEMIPTIEGRWMPVVAAAIWDGQGRVLLQKCPPGKRHAGLWEFPGGKVEPAETPRFALVREIAEELGLQLDPAHLTPVGVADENGENGRPAIVLVLYSADRWTGQPEGLEGQEWDWFELSGAARLPMPPMDRSLLENLAPRGIAKAE